MGDLKTLLCRIYILIAVLALFSTGVALLGRTMPEPAFFPELNGCKPKICFLGIVSGETSRVDAGKLLVQAPGLTQADFYSDVATTWNIPAGTFSSITLFDDDGNEFRVILTLRKKFSLTVGDVINHWGLPCAVEFRSDYNYGKRQTLLYPDKLISILQTDSTIRPDSAVDSVEFNNYGSGYCLIFAPSPYHFNTWRGFRRYVPH